MGKRQHFVPQMLLKGFSSRSKNGSKMFWSFKTGKDGRSVEFNIKNVGFENHFYGQDDVLESKLQSIESASAEAIYKVREGNDPQLFSKILGEFAWLQAVRTKAMRRQLSHTFELALGTLSSEISGRSLRDLIRKKLETELETTLEPLFAQIPPMVAIELRKAMENQSTREQLLGLLIQYVEGNSEFEKYADLIRQALRSPDIPKRVDHSHNSSIMRVLERTTRPNNFGPITWYSQSYSNDELILGDICVFGVRENNDIGSVLHFSGRACDVLLPISRKMLLVGSRDGMKRHFDAPFINAASASLSHEAIFSGTNGDIIRSLSSLIGTRAAFVSDEEVVEMSSRHVLK